MLLLLVGIAPEKGYCILVFVSLSPVSDNGDAVCGDGDDNDDATATCNGLRTSAFLMSSLI